MRAKTPGRVDDGEAEVVPGDDGIHGHDLAMGFVGDERWDAVMGSRHLRSSSGVAEVR